VPSPETILIIPAAGAGTRLQSPQPKVLSPVNGKAMLDHLFDRYGHVVRRVVLVLHPSFESLVKNHVDRVAPTFDVAYATQAAPTGMLDAILLASAAITGAPGRVWITWCDQIGVHPQTVDALDRLSREHRDTAAVFPTSKHAHPYIHLDRDGDGRITAIRQRREGDTMPSVGESDMGLFSLSVDAYFNLLPQFGHEAQQSANTRERNFLPFMPWLVARGHAVMTFPATNELEAIGINTPEDRARLETYLRELERR
jgi:bifunctional N-acetylglucosamine-1-phosphate-uridyltransferase/glucosamine-1-phosphate-acetyltransferase GlmU-like protein